jgi:chorismate synthase
MAGNTFGTAFRLTTFGESHGPAIGGVIDGCPAGLRLDLEAVQRGCNRRRPGSTPLGTARQEADTIEWLSGLYEGMTTGTPLAFLVRNTDARSADYAPTRDLWRPSHADYTYDMKYGFRDHRGGGRASARETVARVIAGEVARALLATVGVRLAAYVDRVASEAWDAEPRLWSPEAIDAFPVRCPDPEAAGRMQACIEAARERGDTVGGSIVAVADGLPAGWGEPVFAKLEATLGGGLLSIPAAKAVEFGSGFAGTYLSGTAHNDVFVSTSEGPRPGTNRSGGLQGGITTGLPLVARVGFKPVATVMAEQTSVDREGQEVTWAGTGRHDPCVLPRAVPIVEAMVALALADAMLVHRAARLA